MKQLIYLGYYLKNLDRARFNTFVRFVKGQSQISSTSLLTDVVRSSIKFKVSLLDYFYFRFHKKTESERATYAGTGYMYEYQLRMNPPAERHILENKLLFNKAYGRFVRRRVASLEDLRSKPDLAATFLRDPSGKLVLKGATGQVGAEVKIVKTAGMNPEQLITRMENEALDLIEAYVVQHRALRELSDSGLNTIRVFSQLDQQNKVVFLGARLRITVNSQVDNMAAGNPAAPVDLETGKVCGPAVYSDITREDAKEHPVTGVPIIGFQVPFWPEVRTMIEQAALLHPQNRSIGWDVAISDEGPELIEGNHNWCKLLWQLPVKKGLKAELEKYR